MCMTQTKEATEIVAKQLEAEGEILAYKMVYSVNGELRSIFATDIGLDTTPVFYKYKAGENISDRKPNEVDHTDANDDKAFHFIPPNENYVARVSKGIHLFLNEQEAKENASRYQKHAETFTLKEKVVVIPVKCKKEDFVGAGYWDCTVISTAVFTKVSITQKDYDEAIRKGQTA